MRRSVITILIGILSTLGGLTTIDYLRARSCTEQVGTWLTATKKCQLTGGEIIGTGTPMIFLAGVFVGAALAFTMYRALLFATGRAKSAFAKE